MCAPGESTCKNQPSAAEGVSPGDAGCLTGVSLRTLYGWLGAVSPAAIDASRASWIGMFAIRVSL